MTGPVQRRLSGHHEPTTDALHPNPGDDTPRDSSGNHSPNRAGHHTDTAGPSDDVGTATAAASGNTAESGDDADLAASGGGQTFGRRQAICLGLAPLPALALAGTAVPAAAASVPSAPATTATTARQQAGPPTVTAQDIRFSAKTLRYGSAREAGLTPEHVTKIAQDTARFLQPSPTHPLFAGAVVLAAHNGVIVTHEAMGDALRYQSYNPATKQGTELPTAERVPMRPDTIFDLASVTKLFTSITVVQQWERGRLDINAPVTQYIPEFAAQGKGEVTLRQLLTHTSGLPAWIPLWSQWNSPQERYRAVYEVAPLAPPGKNYLYSDLNLIALGKIVELVTGKTIDQVIADDITKPLKMSDTGFNPSAAATLRSAATEYEISPPRGMVRGSVHDENAWSLNGIAGHAGVFSTAHDLAVLSQTILNGGHYGKTRILSEDSVRAMLHNENTAFPQDSHGLGFELNLHWYMGALASPVTAGHTGFTGTSMVIDPLSHSFLILLTNRVHPTRDWGSNNPARRLATANLGRALPVRSMSGGQAWFSGMAESGQATLTLPLPTGSATVDFALWYDTEDGDDRAALESSADGGQTWQPVPFDLRSGKNTWSSNGTFVGFAGRRWAQAKANLPAGATALRWRYTTKGSFAGVGRGVYVDAVRLRDTGGEIVFNDERAGDAGLFQANGWSLSDN